jgi:hypothetical protein
MIVIWLLLPLTWIIVGGAVANRTWPRWIGVPF